MRIDQSITEATLKLNFCLFFSVKTFCLRATVLTTKTGYYAGFLASSFTIGRLTTSYVWGHFADRFGRKPVFVIGMLAIAVSSIGFGLSTSFSTAVMWRYSMHTIEAGLQRSRSIHW